jgi:hypothetical protein
MLVIAAVVSSIPASAVELLLPISSLLDVSAGSHA